MKRVLSSIYLPVWMFASVLLVGCNASSSNENDVTTGGGEADDHSNDAESTLVDLAGRWKLQGAIAGFDFVIDDAGRLMAFDGNTLFSGPSSESIYLTDGGVRANGVICQLDPAACDTFGMNLSISSSSSLSGSLSSGGETVDVDLQRVTPADAETGISDVANRTWVGARNATSTLMILDDGSIEGTNRNGDPYTGTIRDTGRNAFAIALELTFDGTAVTVPGLAFVDSNGQFVLSGHLRSGDLFYTISGFYSPS